MSSLYMQVLPSQKPMRHHRSGTGLTFLITFAGEPTATEKSGIDFVTMLPAPIVHPFPIVTPGIMVVLPPIQQSSPMVTLPPYSMPLRRDCTSVSCVAPNIETKGPNRTRWPMVTMPQSRITRLKSLKSALVSLYQRKGACSPGAFTYLKLA